MGYGKKNPATIQISADTGLREEFETFREDTTKQLTEQNSHTETFTHGLNIAITNTPSSAEVEFYGNTLVNNALNFNNSLWSYHANITKNSSNKITLNATSDRQYATLVVPVKPNANMLFNTKLSNGAFAFVEILNESKAFVKTGVYTGYGKFIIPSDGKFVRISLRNVDGFVGECTFEDIRLYEIDQDTYNKIGVSLTETSKPSIQDVFPYVDGIKGVQNPVLRASGSNLNGGFNDLSVLHANAKIIKPYELELNATGTYQQSDSNFIPAVKNTSYTFSLETNARYRIYHKDSSGTVNSITDWLSSPSVTFTTQSNTVSLQVLYSNRELGAGTYYFKNPMLNLGSTALPFVEKNDSYLYAEVDLYGVEGGKKDILYYNEANRRWEKMKWIEPKRKFDGSDDWSITGHSLNVDTKIVKVGDSTITKNSPHFLTEDGNIIPSTTDWATFANSKTALSYVDSGLLLAIPNADSGWLSTWTHNTISSGLTWANTIKAYFNGWKYTGDGTTHSWVSKVDGTTAPLEQTASFVANPANKPNSYENYFLSYMLSAPQTEVEGIDFPLVEGDVSIQGSSQVSVGEGVIVREVANAVSDSAWTYINSTWSDGTLNGSELKNKANQILTVYKNGQVDGNWSFDSVYSYGKQRARISKDKYDPTAEYTVTYELLEKHNFTSNLNEVKVTYQKSIPSTLQHIVGKQSDIATNVSILFGLTAELIRVTKGLEGA